MPPRVVNLAKRVEPTGGARARLQQLDSQKTDDATLVTGAKRKERWALETLIHRYQSKAFAIAYRMTAGDEEQARDLTQEAFVKVLGSINRFKGNSSFYTWFYRIVVNTCLDARRKEQRWRRIFKLNNAPAPDDSMSNKNLESQADHYPGNDPVASLRNKELTQEIKTALAKLSARQRMVFTLKVFEGFSIAEIADIMNTAKGTVKSHLFRATRHMRKALGYWAMP